MKYLIPILPITFLFASCFNCYDCIGPGQDASAWLTYDNNEIVVFESQTNEVESFIITKSENLPPEEYCGQLGSSSYYSCSGGGGRCSLSSVNKNQSGNFSISYDYSNGVGAHSRIYCQFDKMNFSCDNDGSNLNSSDDKIVTLGQYSQNGKNYKHVFHCTAGNIDSTITVTEFYYQKEAGLLNYTTINDNNTTTWILKTP